jgi:hypothetical protein
MTYYSLETPEQKAYKEGYLEELVNVEYWNHYWMLNDMTERELQRYLKGKSLKDELNGYKDKMRKKLKGLVI